MRASELLGGFLGGFGLVLAGCIVGLAVAQEPKEAKKEISAAERASHLDRMKKVAASFHLLANAEWEHSGVKLVDEPILRYSDDTRRTYESSLWVWSKGGRPSAVLAVEYYPQAAGGGRWLYEIASLSTERIAVERGRDLHFTAKEPGLDLQRLRDAPSPADKAARRLTQMKELLRRFAAHERATVEGRIELRPLTSPLFRYAQASDGILDGAIFALANGTNPEVLVVLEAHAAKEGPATWHYSLAQMTGERVMVELDGKEIWKRNLAEPPALRESYVNGYLPAETKEK